MEKRSLIGLALILLLIFLYPFYLRLFSLPQEQKTVEIPQIISQKDSQAQPIDLIEIKNYDTVHDTVLGNKYLEIKTSSQGAGISLIRLILFNLSIYNSNDYNKNLFFFAEPFLNYALNKAIYTYTEKENSVTYSLNLPGQFALEKIFTLEKDTYLLKFTLRIKNLQDKPLPLNLSLRGGENFSSQELGEERYGEIVYAQQEKIKHEFLRQIPHSRLYLGPLAWFAVKSKYFVEIFVPSSSGVAFTVRHPSPQQWEVISQLPLILLSPGETREENFLIYFGPLDEDILKQYNPHWKEIVYYGMFDSIAKSILKLLKLGFLLFKNYGWAIIFLSLLVNLLLFPFTWKSMKAMQALQRLQPQIEQLRKIYSQDPPRLNREILELYRKHKVNPLGGCLPLFLQMPIFIS
ncbi:MAG: membrane protein insertase YidC, partial [Candidatus Omnitrophota bacterium]